MNCFSVQPVTWIMPTSVASNVEIIKIQFFSALLLYSVTEEHRGKYICRGDIWEEKVMLSVFGNNVTVS